MISLATIHEDKITRFQRNHYIISISDLKNKSSIGHEDLQNEEHMTIEAVKRMYPRVTTEGIAGVLLTALQLKIQRGERRFLLSFTDETKRESLDLLNGLVIVFQLEAITEEQKRTFKALRTHAGEWTEAICRVEEKHQKIENALKYLRGLQ